MSFCSDLSVVLSPWTTDKIMTDSDSAGHQKSASLTIGFAFYVNCITEGCWKGSAKDARAAGRGIHEAFPTPLSCTVYLRKRR